MQHKAVGVGSIRYYLIVNAALGLAGFVCLVMGTLSAIRIETTAALALLGTGIALLFASTIERFESIKGLGIEAKQRQLDATLVQAEVILARIKEIAEIVGGNLLDLQLKSGYINDVPRAETLYELLQKISEQSTRSRV
ncbi:hypothetical protein [Xanthomonas vasicola]|uniref:DUF4231 domain-containing protein n=1 Tax=Xanthomonas vasicola TaxID=56459 RepID=A0ABD7SG75_XANVA|nr:hypothetical protein [Xanthomonas vasicola]AZR22667.1 hypothetical protein NX81_010420 [Xanthomonas vasicola]KGR40578.1 hypothetical protein NX04_16110 [Xanthomonas vasicola]KGR42363.1 hypothetical protein NX05_13650 [Xanthomonas vasicola]KGR55965.1 hypothetical protein NX79_21615 [Xanthomonas vasicola]MDO6984364.1 hypothetical protein [Xanthomonas vasicola]